jgi:hypothetical protein
VQALLKAAQDLYIKNSTGLGANESNIHPD